MTLIGICEEEAVQRELGSAIWKKKISQHPAASGRIFSLHSYTELALEPGFYFLWQMHLALLPFRQIPADQALGGSITMFISSSSASCRCVYCSTRLIKLQSNCQTRLCWSNMNRYSVSVLPISYLKCFLKHILVYCLAWIRESLWAGCR